MPCICGSNLSMIVSDNGLSPSRCQAIFLTNAALLLIGQLETNISEILINQVTIIFIQKNAYECGVCGISVILSRPHCVNLCVIVYH